MHTSTDFDNDVAMSQQWNVCTHNLCEFFSNAVDADFKHYLLALI